VRPRVHGRVWQAARRRGAAPVLVAFAIAFVAYAGALVIIGAQSSGDEPHYLLEARSLAETGSRDLRDDYADPARVAWALGGTTPVEPHAFTYGDSDRLISIHGVGLPLLLAPVAAVTDSVFAMRLWLCMLAAAGAALLFDVLRLLGVLRGAWLWAVWAAGALSLPAVVFAHAAYPESVGALCVLVVVRALLTRPPSTAWMAAGGVAAAALPWLHVRFLPVALGLVLALAVRARRGRALALAVAPTVVALAVLGAFWVDWYGSLDPRAPYEVPRFEQTVASQFGLLYPNALGTLLSPDYGWLPWAPVGLIAVAALGWVCWRRGWWAVWGLLLAGGYLVMVGLSNVYPSYNPPGRFVMLLLPVATLPLAYAVARWRAARWAFVPLAVLTALWLVVGVTRSEQLAPTGTGEPAMALAANLDAPWPKFVWDDRELNLRHSEGTLTWRGLRLPPATYVIAFSVRAASDVPPDTVVAKLTVRARDAILQRRPIRAGELPGGERTFIEPFRVEEGAGSVDVELTPSGRADVRSGGMQIVSVRNTLGGASKVRYADWGLTAAWVLLLGGLSVAMVVEDRRRPVA